ncbi:MAG: hypothetical protein GYB33_13645 [Gammaproteobacteria bacterium]|uniref:hypothetical protein n=1 Tax=Pseudomaricurvus alcaniphilus TaxID=1166482 RepID=UPI00140C3D92|nr:hypothetical protein [Pseudomaricurvus alcaniphilus]MBR9911386.1 hypothetical protein [Gammaproteobacteria bacterium]NHN36824.1 hypothetical protein [Pseudomaricurvus alcaniphilus]
MAISPSGEMIAYRRTEDDKKDFLIVYSLKRKKQIAAVGLGQIQHRSHYFVNEKNLILIGSRHLN